MKKRSFTAITISYASLVILALKSVLSGILYALAVFFTNKKLKDWIKKEE